ncbi:hypothetical protein AOLI_G00155120 [Acnodon oligacanthus]
MVESCKQEQCPQSHTFSELYRNINEVHSHLSITLNFSNPPAMKTLVTLVLVYKLFSEALQASAVLQCYKCEGLPCSESVTCDPEQDRCQTTTVGSSGQKNITKGCITKAECDMGGSMNCCSTNLCNGAEGVKLSLLIMLVPLISTLFI